MAKTILTVLAIFCMSFLANGQEPNEQLYQAIVKNDKDKVVQLLKGSADANYVISSGPWMKVNMLITAVNNGHIEIVKLLIAHKADVNWKDGFNTTALMYAASKGGKDMVMLLLENGADIKVSDGQGNTVLTAARESRNKDLIKFIQDKLKEKK